MAFYSGSLQPYSTDLSPDFYDIVKLQKNCN